MNELFVIYEDSFNIVLKKVVNILDTYSNLPKDKHELVLKDAEINLKESERILKQMELELTHKINHKNYDRNIVKLKNYKIDFETVRKRMMKIQDNIHFLKSQDELLGGLDDRSVNNLQKQKLIENEDYVWKQSTNLSKAKMSTLNLENVSIEVMKQLDTNNNNLRGINSRVLDLNGELDNSQSIMGRIMKKENRNKLLIVIFSILLLGVFCFVIYLKLK